MLNSQGGKLSGKDKKYRCFLNKLYTFVRYICKCTFASTIHPCKFINL